MKQQAFATAKHAVLLERTEKVTHYTLNYTPTPKDKHRYPRYITSMQAMHGRIHMCIYILTHRMHRLIGISSAAVQYINIHVYNHI